jgi:hypothetical protein
MGLLGGRATRTLIGLEFYKQISMCLSRLMVANYKIHGIIACVQPGYQQNAIVALQSREVGGDRRVTRFLPLVVQLLHVLRTGVGFPLLICNEV